MQGLGGFLIEDESIALDMADVAPTVTAPRFGTVRPSLDSVRHGLETSGLFIAASASLVNALADGRIHHLTYADQIAATLPPDPRWLETSIGSLGDLGTVSDALDRLIDFPVRLSLARGLGLALARATDRDPARARDIEGATDAWWRLCDESVLLIRALGSRTGGRTAANGGLRPNVERLLAACAHGGSPCVDHHGLVAIPGWLERRTEPRLQVDVAGLLRVAGATHGVRILDISRNGAGVGMAPAVPVGTAIALSIAGLPAAIPGRTIWSAGARCGIAFDWPLTSIEAILATSRDAATCP